MSRFAAHLGDQLQDLDLPIGELGSRPGGAAACRCGGEEGEGTGCHADAEHDLADRNRLDGPDHLVPLGPLDQVAVRTGAHRSEQRLVVVEHGEYQHRRLRGPGRWPTRRLEPQDLTAV